MKIYKRTHSSQLENINSTFIKVAIADDEVSIVDVIVRAFEADPVVRWAWPDSQFYHTDFSSFVQMFGGKAFSQGSAYFVDGYAGAALWLPPNTHPDEESLNILFQRTVPEERQADLFNMFEEMDGYHPSEPHWYLPLIGVDPSQQDKSYGSALDATCTRAV